MVDSGRGWRVRIEDAAGASWGTGVLLGGRHVLTCAHVLEDAGAAPERAAEVRVWVAGRRGGESWRSAARLVPDCFVPKSDTQRGDVALLELEAPLPRDVGARLRMAPIRGVVVQTFGFPAEILNGMDAEARLVTTDQGERVLMKALPGTTLDIRRGFSGAGVVDASGDVLGIVVAVYEDDPRLDGRPRAYGPRAYMLPVESIVNYLPPVRDYVVGAGTIDSGTAGSGVARMPTLPGSRTDTAAIALAREVGRMTADDWSGTCVITGGAAGTPWLRWLLATADPAARREISDATIASVPRETVLALGCVDARVDARGATVGEVCRRLAARFALPDPEPGRLVDDLVRRDPPATSLLTGVDAAAEPAALLRDLLAPLAARTRRRGGRLLLGYDGEPPDELPYEVSVGTEMIVGSSKAPVEAATAGRLVDELAAAEQELTRRHAEVERVFLVPRPPRRWAPRLRIRLAAPHAAGDAEPAAVHVVAGAALAAVREHREELARLRPGHDELVDRLEVWRSRVEPRLGAEDPELGNLYADAYQVLRSAPCDLGAARRRVERYCVAARRRLEGQEDDQV